MNEKVLHKPHCILHIGMPKTGSSVLQEALYQSEAKGSLFDYIAIGSFINANHLYSLFSNRPASYYLHIYEGKTADEIAEFNIAGFADLKTKLLEATTDRVILSGEGIVFLEEDELCRLRDFLLNFVTSVQVIGYVRPPISFMQSSFQQNIKVGDLRWSINGGYAPGYRSLFEKFDRVFGKKQVTLIKFDRNSLLDGEIVADFFSRVGIYTSASGKLMLNESITLEALAMLYVFHKLGTHIDRSSDFVEKNEALAKLLNGIGTQRVEFSSQLSTSIIGEISEDIAWIESRLGTTMAEHYPAIGVGISSEDDLFEIALANTGKLGDLIAEEIKKQLTSPHKIADWINLLRNNLALQPAFTRAQVERLEAVTLQPAQLLSELVLSLRRTGHHKALANVQNILTEFQQNVLDKRQIDSEYAPDLLYSLDLYLDGFIMGWVYDKKQPLKKLSVEIMQGRRVIACGTADQFRQDLADVEFGDGCCAFRLRTDVDPTVEEGDVVLRVVDFGKEFQIRLK